MKILISLLLGLILSTSIVHPQIRNEELKYEALQLMNMGRYGEAIDVLNRFVAANPQNIEGFLLRGTCYEKRGEFEFAVYDYRTAKKIAPADAEVNNKLNAAINSWYKLLYNKIEGHKREIAIHPDRGINYLEVGIAYKLLGEWKEAEVWYEEYLKRNEPSADEVLRYAEILAKNNQLIKGEQILKKYSAINSNDHRIWSRYGYFLHWLGKNRLAINAFEESLKIRPFFKEALDGLDLARGRGYVYTINDTTTKYFYGLPPGTPEYVIDRLFRILRNKPKDDDTRFKLIDELVNAKRFEEAYEQLRFLSGRYSGTEDFDLLYSRVLEYRKAHYKNKIDEYRLKLSADPDNLEALKNLARYYSYQGEFISSKEMYEKYLNLKPGDSDERFGYAQLLTWNNELCLAKDEADILLIKNPDKTDYQLLRANIGLWLDEDLEISRNLFEKILSKQPDNNSVLFGLAYLNLRTDDVIEAENYYLILSEDESIPEKELSDLAMSIDLSKRRIKDQILFDILESARKSTYENNCDEAVIHFKKYFEMGGNEELVYFELAGAYQCLKDFTQAIKIYDELILKGFDDYEISKQRAKIIFWSGDSLRSFREFKKLVDLNPDDAEAKLYLGDNYMQLKQYQSAREIYSELLNISPESHIVRMRMKWLGSAGISSFSFDTFPTYILVSPQASYFSDNSRFKYSLIGLGFEIGATNLLSFGFSGYRGALSSEFSRLNFNNLKGSLFFRFNDNVRLSGSIGQTYFANNRNENIIESVLNMEKKDVYKIAIFYHNMDASLILYSPFLVTNRLTADHIGFNGEYSFRSRFMVSGKYSFINVSDGNEGNQLQFRLGKEFDDDIKAGYEYYYYTLSAQTELYWSPENFEAHSVWADFNLINDEDVSFTLGGKLGLIPENDFLLREFYTQFRYLFAKNFNIQARLVTGSSSRSGVGYNSTSFQVSAFWTL